MPIVTGQNAQLTTNVEATWGSTANLSAISFSNPPFQSFEWEPVKDPRVIENINSSPSLRSLTFGRQVIESRLRASIDYDNFIVPFYMLFGTGVRTVSGSAFLYNFSLASLLPTGLMVEIDHTEAGGWTWNSLGNQVNRAQFSMDADGGLQGEFGMAGATATTQVAPEQTNAQAVSELAVSSDVSTATIFGASVTCLRDWNITIEQPLDTDQACVGGTGLLTSKPGRAGARNITFDATLALDDTLHWSRFEAGTTGALNLVITGDSALGGLATVNMIRFQAPKMKLRSWREVVDDAGRIFQRMSFQVLQSAASNDELTASIHCGTSVASL